MTPEEIIERLESSTLVGKVVKRMRVWDESLTIKENAKNLGISRGLATNFRHKYGLRANLRIRFKSEIKLDIESKIRKLFLQGVRRKSIATALGIPYFMVVRAIKRLDINEDEIIREVMRVK